MLGKTADCWEIESNINGVLQIETVFNKNVLDQRKLTDFQIFAERLKKERRNLTEMIPPGRRVEIMLVMRTIISEEMGWVNHSITLSGKHTNNIKEAEMFPFVLFWPHLTIMAVKMKIVIINQIGFVTLPELGITVQEVLNNYGKYFTILSDLCSSFIVERALTARLYAYFWGRLSRLFTRRKSNASMSLHISSSRWMMN